MNRQAIGALVLASLFFAAHAAFLPSALEDVDSINFALGVRDYDVAQHQPHPPGYPLYILAAKVVNMAAGSEPLALALLSAGSGAAAVLALLALYGTLAPRLNHPGTVAIAATLVAATAPLFWFTAARPLSDIPGLAVAVAVQVALLRSVTETNLARTAVLAGLAAGVRSQVVWLTLPLLLLQWVRLPGAKRWRAALTASAGYAAGALLWFVPLLVVSGGAGAYWAALVDQGAEDFSGVVMLWTQPSPRLLLGSLAATYLTPWSYLPLGAVLVACSAIGAVRLVGGAAGRWILITLAVAYGPYHLFNLLFQEVATVRYVVPMVVPVAFLSVAGVNAFWPRATLPSAAAAALFSLTAGMPAVSRYAAQEAPAFRALADVRDAVTPPSVVAMHRRAAFDLRRPLAWLGDAAPVFGERLTSPPKHEWLELVRYWNGGGRAPVWFMADPLRSDLALIRHDDPARYEWPFEEAAFLGGVRPGELDVYRLDPPEWYLSEGWALTPETAGVAREDARGPGLAPIQGWIRRTAGAATLMIGGRNLAGPDARVRVAIDDTSVDEFTVAPGFFLKWYDLPAGTLDGAGDYARLEVSADSAQIAVEQFDCRSEGRVMFGFGAGWHEHEYDPATGRRWRWMSDRGTVEVRQASAPMRLTLAAEIEADTRSRVTVAVGNRVLHDAEVHSPFQLDLPIPSDARGGAETRIELTTSAWDVPADRRWRPIPDPRRLGLKVFRLDVAPDGPSDPR